jgi:hypothetical protein
VKQLQHMIRLLPPVRLRDCLTGDLTYSVDEFVKTLKRVSMDISISDDEVPLD